MDVTRPFASVCAVVPLAVVIVFDPPFPVVTPGFAAPVVPLAAVFVAPPVRPVVADVLVLAVPAVVPVPRLAVPVVPVPRFAVPVVPAAPPGRVPPGVVPPGFAPPGAAAGAFAGAFGAAAGAFGALGADLVFCAEAIPGAITNAKITNIHRIISRFTLLGFITAS
jgi:hypothetical protein